MSGRPLTLLGVPIDSVGEPGGTELGPAALRERLAPPGSRTRATPHPPARWRARSRDRLARLRAGLRADGRGARARRRPGRRGQGPGGVGRVLHPRPRARWRAPGTRSASAGSPTWTATSTSTRARPRRRARRPTSRWRPPSGGRRAALLDRLGGGRVVDPERVELLGPRDEEEAVGFGSATPREVGSRTTAIATPCGARTWRRSAPRPPCASPRGAGATGCTSTWT